MHHRRLRETCPDVRRPLVPAQSACNSRPHPRHAATRRRVARTLALALLCCAAGAPAAAQDDSREAMQGLDEQVQEIKSDVLAISAELSLLEERLLYPSNTQVAVFVSLAEGETFRLDSVRVEIDGAPVAHHIYSFEELEALRKGGVQRIYTGNVPTGEHRIDVAIAGLDSGGGDFAGSESFTFRKEVEPEQIGITLSGGSGSPAIQLGAW